MFSSFFAFVSSSAAIFTLPFPVAQQTKEEDSEVLNNIDVMKKNDCHISITSRSNPSDLALVAEKLSDAPTADDYSLNVTLFNNDLPRGDESRIKGPASDGYVLSSQTLLFNPSNAPLNSLVRKGDGFYSPDDSDPAKQLFSAKTNDDKNHVKLPQNGSRCAKPHKDTFVPRKKPVGNFGTPLSSTGLVFNVQAERPNVLTRRENRERWKKADDVFASKMSRFPQNSSMKKVVTEMDVKRESSLRVTKK